MQPTVRVHGVGKAYRRVERGYLVRRLFEQRAETPEFWPIRNVSLDLQPHEICGVIGENGCGKTTLLSMIAGTTQPTEGTVTTRGRVVSLLALGVGASDDMIGDEVLELEGALFGLTRAEIHACAESIWAFAELDDDVKDTPLCHYSSGMRARLSFAIAVHTSPKVLLVDEVLAVGDESFREKCCLRIEEMSRAGTSVIFVSHDLGLVQRICGRALWLHEGRVTAEGEPAAVIARYKDAMVKRGAIR
jgi:lipopolysaccharide transport system ATP-binding protein